MKRLRELESVKADISCFAPIIRISGHIGSRLKLERTPSRVFYAKPVIIVDSLIVTLQNR